MKIFRVSTLEPLHRAFLQVKTDLDALIPVLEWFDQFSSPPTPPKAWMECQLALAEGFTNAVRHAHADQPEEALIDLEVQVFDDRLEFRIWDQGPPFDFDAQLERMPPLGLDTEVLTEGGRGLLLMKRIADHLSYVRTSDERNCLLLVKKFLPSLDA